MRAWTGIVHNVAAAVRLTACSGVNTRTQSSGHLGSAGCESGGGGSLAGDGNREGLRRLKS